MPWGVPAAASGDCKRPQRALPRQPGNQNKATWLPRLVAAPAGTPLSQTNHCANSTRPARPGSFGTKRRSEP